MRSTITRRAGIAITSGALLLAATGATVAAVASASPAKTSSHVVHVWVTPGKGAVDKILLTGAIGDFGTATSTTKSGKVDTNGHYVKVKLRKGGFVVNAVAFNRRLGAKTPKVDKASCTAWLTGGGNVTLSDGTGAYAGISGTLKIETSYAFLGPLHKTGPQKGKCNLADSAVPLDVFMGSIVGSGSVTM
jgi:hypothetical protein